MRTIWPKEISPATNIRNDRLTIIFVTDGLESAMEPAKAAAGEKDVTVVGGANTAQQCLNARLFDELHIGIVPIVLGRGLQFFDNVSIGDVQLEKIDILESPSRIDIKYRLVK
jgi:dihydrofolate reductase